jgi:3-deoxy-D-manno-octulosonate 8-phosphate phosphatase (KDO 8-P phosphatase)
MKFTPQEVYKLFASEGAVFCHEVNELASRWHNIRAIILDWDGVFNDGSKTSSEESSFSEIDSMGLNILRYSIYQKHGTMPNCAIISGMGNPAAIHFAKREHFDFAFLGFKNKLEAFNFLLKETGLKPMETAFWYDDILDLPLAEKCGFRIHINQKVSHLLKMYILDNNLADFVTSHSGGNGAIRESCEMLLGISGQYVQSVQSRAAYDASYASYFSARQSIPTRIFAPGHNGQPAEKP